MQWETVIGLEVHVQLKTQSKIFSGASTNFGAPPNQNACAIDLGLPGVLPVLNHQAVQMAIKFGLATDCEISKRSIFARKNYFYPDLPKGYQISQYELPIVHGGHLDIPVNQDEVKRIGITRAHLEEDAGKSIHDAFDHYSGIDLNRAGVPLLEVVSEPDLRSAQEAVAYLKTLHCLVQYLEICDGNLQEGSFRCDANVSIRPKGQKTFGTRTEMKNINSFRFVEQAILYEVERQIDLLESGGQVIQQTRLYDPVKHQTRAMREKEEANDYRYFPDPDLLPVIITDSEISAIKAKLPELPQEKLKRFIDQYGLSPYDANVLTAQKSLADFFEQTEKKLSQPNHKLLANWTMGELLGALNKANLNIEQCPITCEHFATLINRISDQTISGKIAKTVFEQMFESKQSPDAIIEEKGLKQVTDSGLIESMVDEVIANNPQQLEQYRQGKDKLFGFFVGQVLKASKGKANPQQVNEILKRKLKS